MDEYTKQLIEEARATYKDVVAGDDSRIQRGKILWDQFEAAAEACRTGGKESERRNSASVSMNSLRPRCSPMTNNGSCQPSTEATARDTERLAQPGSEADAPNIASL